MLSSTPELTADLHELLPFINSFIPSRNFTNNRQSRDNCLDESHSEYMGEDELQSISAAVRKAFEKWKLGAPDIVLTEDEERGVAAFKQMLGRPALYIQNGDFPQVLTEEWRILDDHRTSIQTVLKSVGRIEATDGRGHTWFGTGFLAATDVVMTNRHVAEEFCEKGECGQWQLKPEVREVRIDFVEEKGSGDGDSAEFLLTEIIGFHPDENIDIALFRMSTVHPEEITAPEPLTLASDADLFQVKSKVYVIGYPGFDRRYSREILALIFQGLYEIKRLQPGETTALHEEHLWFTHDCSTLNGNSGSCVVDLATGQVLGIHFRGNNDDNFAVALWQLQDDPLIKKAKLNYA